MSSVERLGYAVPARHVVAKRFHNTTTFVCTIQSMESSRRKNDNESGSRFRRRRPVQWSSRGMDDGQVPKPRTASRSGRRCCQRSHRDRYGFARRTHRRLRVRRIQNWEIRRYSTDPTIASLIGYYVIIA
jgi:hypothetical protein